MHSAIAARNRLAVWAERDAVNLADVAGHFVEFLAGGRVPQPHGSILAARQDARTIRRERRADDALRVAIEDAQTFAGVGVPQPQRRGGTAGQDALAVGR